MGTAIPGEREASLLELLAARGESNDKVATNKAASEAHRRHEEGMRQDNQVCKKERVHRGQNWGHGRLLQLHERSQPQRAGHRPTAEEAIRLQKKPSQEATNRSERWPIQTPGRHFIIRYQSRSNRVEPHESRTILNAIWKWRNREGIWRTLISQFS